MPALRALTINIGTNRRQWRPPPPDLLPRGEEEFVAKQPKKMCECRSMGGEGE